MDIDRDILRWILLIGATPIWLPFVRTLWKDFNAALREEGGLLGAPPTGRELETIKREREKEPDTLTSEPLVRSGEQRTKDAVKSTGSVAADAFGYEQERRNHEPDKRSSDVPWKRMH